MSQDAIVPGSPEHAAAMIALADAEGVQVRALDSQGRVQGVQEGAPAATTETTDPTSLAIQSDAAKTEVQEDPTENPPDTDESPFQEFYKEFEETGDVSTESKTKLLEVTRKAGLPDEMVQAYIDGQKALKGAAQTAEQQAELVATAARNAGFAAVGGEKAYGQMTQWARSNLSQAELVAFNAQVDSSKESALLAIDGLKARWTKATGQTPGRSLQGGAQGSGESITGFANQDEVYKAMSSAQYKTDAKYRQTVAQRLALTNDNVTGTRLR